MNGEFEPNGNLAYIRIFSIVAFLLLIVACINFMNLTTASSSIRAREIGVRKTNGASRRKLQQQFFSEAIIVSILDLIMAMGLVESIMGPYRIFTGREIEVHYLDNFLVIPGLLALDIVVGLLSGSYPALYMSNFSAIDSLGFKGVKQSTSWFRNILVLFQFSVAIFLIAATLLVQKQMHLIMEEGRFFSKEFDDPIGKITYLWGQNSQPYEVIGVVEDYHWESKHMEIRPLAIMLLGAVDWDPGYLSVRIAGIDYKKMIKILECCSGMNNGMMIQMDV